MKKVFSFLFFSYFLFFFLIPPFQTPDEGTHFDFVYWLSVGVLPTIPQKDIPTMTPSSIQYSVFQGVDSFAQNIPNFRKVEKSNLQKRLDYLPLEKTQFQAFALQAYNPPLYYFIASLFLRLARIFHTSLLTEIYVVRLTSGIFYFFTVVFTYKVFFLVFKKENIANGLTLFFGLNPLLSQSGIGISPDIALIFFTSVFLYLLARYQSKTILMRDTLCSACVVGLACLSKVSGIVLIPGFFILLFLKVKDKQKLLQHSILFAGVIFILQFPWLLSNFIHYHEFIIAAPAFGFTIAKASPTTFLTALVASVFGFRHIFMQFSGFLGWSDAYPFPFIFIPYALAFFIFLSLGLYISLKQKTIFGKVIVSSTGCLFLFFLAVDISRKVLAHQTWEIGGRDSLFMFLPFTVCIAQGFAYIFHKKMDVVAKWLGYFSLWYYYFILVFVLVPRFYV